VDSLGKNILQQLISGSADPLLVARTDSADWPIVLSNPAFGIVSKIQDPQRKPLADVVESLIGRELAVEVSEAVRASQQTTIPVEVRGTEYALVLTPLESLPDASKRFVALYWRAAGTTSGSPAGNEMHQALLRAKRRIRDLSRDDPATGLLNETAFLEILDHDWAVAAREKSTLALVCFTLDDFGSYREVFGRHAADTCIRRVGQAIRRFLRRASDVAARVEDDKLIVLSHSSEESGVLEFAERIAAAVRELGLHHPRSEKERFVTVSCCVRVAQPDSTEGDAQAFLHEVTK
jgi:diguanylate cyclase (GGDEF)-like protein